MAIKGSFPSSAPELTTLLFDLDGTLVDMRRRGLELALLLRGLFRFAPAFWPWRFRRAFWRAAERMQHHGTERVNYQVFLDTLAAEARVGRAALEEICRRFISDDLGAVAGRLLSPVEGARETLLYAESLGYRVVLATNPVWPLEGVRIRLAAGGLDDFAFAYITHSEVMTRCKPDPGYYREVLDRLQLSAEECLMIGNDPRKDLPAREVGIRTFLVDRPGEPPARIDDPRLDGRGTFSDLRAWMKNSKEGKWNRESSV
jgi:FMN phosphatase YigB (HAD superfamily)